MALISVEDLAELDDEQLDDDVADGSEPMEDNDEERLYAHWQAVASTHQVSVPREMTGPIQEMTRRNQEGTPREQVPFLTVSRREAGDSVYEERVYPPGKWACVTRGEKLYEQSISLAFMKLMRYICKENSLGRYLGMTVPIVTEIQMLDGGNGFVKEVVTAYYLPADFQDEPPEATDPDIYIVQRESLRVVTRVFRGTTNEQTIMNQVNQLWDLLEDAQDLRHDAYMVAVYENPGVPCHRNEIWFIHPNP